MPGRSRSRRASEGFCEPPTAVGPQADAWGCGRQLTPRVGAGLRIVEELDAR